MERTLPPILAAVVGIAAGALATWLILDQRQDAQPESGTEIAADASPELERDLENAQAETDTLRKIVESSRRQVQDLEAERDEARKELAGEQERAADLADEVKRLKEQLDAPEKPEAQPEAPAQGNLAVPFGKWADLPEVRDADWTEIGGAAKGLVPLLKELAENIRDGKEMSPELLEKIGEHNQALIAYWARIRKALPTYASVNGEFSHPINMANMLAAHLELAGMPLSDAQIAAIQKLGAEYDSRWEETTKAYDVSTFELQKLLDEGELKEWFKGEMLGVCTPQQRAVAVPPEIDGLVGLDIYSAGVMLQMNVNDVRAPDTETMNDRLKDEVAKLTGIERAVLDGAEFLFNDWVVTLQAQLTPRPQAQMNQYHIGEVLKSARAQLKVYKELYASYAQDAEVKKRVHDSARILYPRIPQP